MLRCNGDRNFLQEWLRSLRRRWLLSGPQVAELIGADARIHFTGQASMSGTEYSRA